MIHNTGIKDTHILVIDDEFEYCEELVVQARKFNFFVAHFQNFEDGFNFIEKNKKIKALILDGKCILNKDQEPGTGKSNFVFHSINRLHHLELEDNRYIPYCVNAYEPEIFSENLEGITKIFKKKEEHNLMFEFLRQKIEESDETQLKHKYEDIFEFANNHFDEDSEDLLIELLLNAEEKDSPTLITNLGILRRLEEKLFDIIAEKYLKADPQTFRVQRYSRTKGIIFHLKNKQIIPQYLFNFSMDIYNIPSKYGNHNPNNENQNNSYLPGNYTVLSLSNSLMELISWAKNLLLNPTK